jgi:hypothetical protein
MSGALNLGQLLGQQGVELFYDARAMRNRVVLAWRRDGIPDEESRDKWAMSGMSVLRVAVRGVDMEIDFCAATGKVRRYAWQKLVVCGSVEDRLREEGYNMTAPFKVVKKTQPRYIGTIRLNHRHDRDGTDPVKPFASVEDLMHSHQNFTGACLTAWLRPVAGLHLMCHPVRRAPYDLSGTTRRESMAAARSECGQDLWGGKKVRWRERIGRLFIFKGMPALVDLLRLPAGELCAWTTPGGERTSDVYFGLVWQEKDEELAAEAVKIERMIMLKEAFKETKL